MSGRMGREQKSSDSWGVGGSKQYVLHIACRTPTRHDNVVCLSNF